MSFIKSKAVMKCVFSLLLATVLLHSCIIFATAATKPNPQKEITVFVNGKQLQFDVHPYIKNNRTMVPFRAFMEALNLEVTWVGSTRTALGESETLSIQLSVGKNTAYVNGYEIALDVSPEVKNGRTFIPLRFVSENAGAYVIWDKKSSKVDVTYPCKDYSVGQVGFFKDIKYTLDLISRDNKNGSIQITGRITSREFPIMIVGVDGDGVTSAAGPWISETKKGEFYLFSDSLSTDASFKPKRIILKMLTEQKTWVTLGEYPYIE